MAEPTSTPPTAIVRRVWNETARLTGVVLEVGADVAAAYQRPGQYVTLHPEPGVKVMVAIASAPGEARAIELLLGPPAREKLRPAEGLAIPLDPPAGKGFDLSDAGGKDVLMFGVGSGLSALRPIIEVVRRRRDAYGRVALYAGAHTAEDHPYRGYEEAWTRDEIRIVRAISKPWVQDLFRKDPLPVENAVAFVVGMRAMVEGVTEVLASFGLSKDRVRLNW